MSVFSNQLIKWYRLNFRQLPWRETVDPYKIWVSEIILQQTRVAQGLPYYEKIIARFPNVKALAAAEEKEILKLWQGLGYYSRARNMHHAAKLVVEFHKGVFPDRYKDLIKLKGIGEYTASAVSSFSSNEKQAVVDGNVFRVLSRYFGIEEPIDTPAAKKIFKEKAFEILPNKNPGMHNQAIMEFGALQCVPNNPDCFQCIFHSDCFAFQNGKINELPIKKNKTKVLNRYMNYFVIHDGKSVLLQKRNKKDIWEGLYDFPLVESIKKEVTADEKKQRDKIISAIGKQVDKAEIVKAKHLLSHRQLFINFHIYKTRTLPDLAGFEKIKLSKKTFPGVPQVIMKLMENQNWFRKP